MAIIINSVNDRYFDLNGIQHAKIYQPLAQGSSSIGLYSIYDTKKQLLNSTKFDEFIINGYAYLTQKETIQVLLPVIWASVSQEDVETLKEEVSDLKENQYSGVEVYSTFAGLPATGTLLVSYKVSNDATSSNNGYYHWTGSAYVKDASLPVGIISDGNADAISGNTAFDYINDIYLKRQNNYLSKDAKNLKNNTAGLLDIWFDEGSVIPTGYNLFIWYFLQSPASGVTQPTIYINSGTTTVNSNSASTVCGYNGAVGVATGIQEVSLTEFNSSGVKMKAIIDWDKVLGTEAGSATYSKLDIAYIIAATNEHEKINLLQTTQDGLKIENEISGIFDSASELSVSDIDGIIDIELLTDSEAKLDSGDVYLWIFADEYPSGAGAKRYIYFTDKEYTSFADVVSYSEITRQATSIYFKTIEKFIAVEQNGSGLSFLVTVNWGLISSNIVDNGIKLKISKNIKRSNVDKIKQKYFLKENSVFEKLRDGFIKSISKSNDPVDKDKVLGIWYVENTVSYRRIYINIFEESNAPKDTDAGIFSLFSKVGQGIGEEEIVVSAYYGDVDFTMLVDWDKITLGTASAKYRMILDLDNVPLTDPTNDYQNFDYINNLPILTNHLFLRSDKATPIFKNSCFQKLINLEKVNLSLLTSTKTIEINEPTNINEEISGVGKFILSRSMNFEKLIFKDILIFYKNIAEIISTSVKIMSLGDSLTEGIEWKDTPVSMLADELTSIGIEVEYIGSLARDFVNKQSETVRINYEGRGGWRYRTFTGLESVFAGINLEIPASPTKSEWLLGVDGATMNDIKKFNPFLYPATAQDKIDFPDFCFNFVVGNTGYNTSYSEDDSLIDYVIFNPVEYFSQRSIVTPDILTIALGTNEWYLPSWDLETASSHAQFIIERFREVDPLLNIVIIPANALNLRRQLEWEGKASVLTTEIIKICEGLIAAGDNNLFVCPVYLNSSRTLGFDGYLDAAVNLNTNNSTKSISINNNVHSLYIDDESNNQYAEALSACVVNLIT